MDIFWDKFAREDYLHWINTDNKALKKINYLIKECQRTPFEGTGIPEALKLNLSGFWSRRITGEHRLVYKVKNDVWYIA
ncbi:Txe/YoeB family addiction module toxin [Mangrovibacterium marinum]|uniref:Putative mRNA interferase YoeB n=1 Tax=Mangrovibacterium marinum TaxID=1639118 RepID=A0A2T5C1I0_9BACT|nr:Txe/YoeB family addiction module toxin [Mangrovibacterium marinum]PTN08485.1 toxin YoeB [Mangrovibacterium marinum]